MNKTNSVETNQVERIVMFGVFVFLVWFFYMIIVHPQPYNTEQVCFNDEGGIVFYSSGFKPSETPVVNINGKKYKNIETGETINGTCKWSWGVNKPKGYDYWKLRT